MTAVLAPDIEAMLIAYLAGHPRLTTATVATAVPQTPPAELVTVTLLAGPRTTADIWLSAGRFQLAAWAPTQPLASELARRVRAAVLDCVNVRSAGGVITGATVTQGAAWFPDQVRTPPTPRYLMVIDLVAHP